MSHDEQIIPQDWMPAAEMERIIFHWTAGSNTASEEDLKHYHILIEGTGALVRGYHSITDNESTSDEVYAAHTKDCNTGSIGVALCGMHDAIESPFNPGPYPINESQWNMLSIVLRDLCAEYEIWPDAETVLSHAEVEANLKIDQEGKWDIARLPWNPAMTSAFDIGEQMRYMVRALLEE